MAEALAPRRSVEGERDERDELASARWDRAVLVLVAATAAASAVLFWFVHEALIDDAYITLSYARNLAFRLHWGLTPELESNSATSPLNVIVLAAVTAVLRDPVWALAVVYVSANAALAWAAASVTTSLRLPVAAAALAVALVVLNPFVLSATGMESTLAAALLVFLVAAALRGEPLWFGVAAGLAVLTRLDLVFFVLPLWLLTPALRRALQVPVAIVVLAGPWYLWSWFHFGSAIPDTFVIKTAQTFGPWTFSNGYEYWLGKTALATAAAFWPAAAGALALLAWTGLRVARPSVAVRGLGPVAALAFGGVVYFLAYRLLRVPPYAWYYCPSQVSLTVALCLFVSVVARHAHSVARSAAFGGLVVLGAVAVVEAGLIVDRGRPWREPITFGNWALVEDYRRIGLALASRVGDATVRSAGEIGTLAFYCDCQIVDAFADRGRVMPLVEKRLAEAGPLSRALLELNFHHLDRGLRPQPVDFRLRWRPGRAKGPDSWNTYSQALGHGHIDLVPRKR